MLCLLGMQILAAFYLRTRRLSLGEYLGWGLLVALVPALGPFLTILVRPGKSMNTTARRRGKSFRTPSSRAEMIRKFALRIRLTKP